MHDQPERSERDDAQEGSNQDPAPMKESDAERVTGEQAEEVGDESGSDSDSSEGGTANGSGQ